MNLNANEPVCASAGWRPEGGFVLLWQRLSAELL